MDYPLNFFEKVQQYIFKNILSILWTASLLVGGFIFWLYFFQIQYFPDLDFDESVLFLVVAAITGIFFLLFFSFLFMSPYFFRGLMLWAQQKPSPPSEKEKTSDIELTWYFGSILLLYLAFFLYFYLGEYHWLLYIGIPCSIVLVIILGHFRVYSSLYEWIEQILQRIKEILQGIKKKPLSKKDEQEPKNINMFGAWFSSCLIFIMPILVLVPIVDKIESTEIEKIEIYAMLLGGIMAGNFMFAYFQERTKKPLWRWIIPFFIVFFVFLIVGKPVTSQIPKAVIKTYKFGNFNPQRLLLNESGCNILKSLGFKADPSDDQKICSLENIKILSRLGRSFYIETTCKPPWLCVPPLRFTIPSKHVLSWSVPVPDKRNKAGTKEDSNP
jgi:hypothetical protein